MHEKNVQECEPEVGADECWEVYGDNLFTWQETVEAGETDWRTISQTETGNLRVTLISHNLNAGFMPTADGQGHYESEEHFGRHLHLLLGVEPDQAFQIVQHGSTTKVTSDRQSLSPATTGNFVFDALSDENGNVYINGEQIEWNPNTIHHSNIIGDTTESETTTQTIQQAQTLRGDANQVDFGAWKSNYCWYKSIGSELDNFLRDGKETHTEFYWAGGWWPWYRTVKVTANYMYLENAKYECDGRTGWCTQFERPSERKSNTDSLELKASAWGAPGCSEIWLGDGICSFAEVSDVELLSGVESAGSTPSECPF